ncbi:unnamed protein product, partial [Amoebophrya sp. A25]
SSTENEWTLLLELHDHVLLSLQQVPHQAQSSGEARECHLRELHGDDHHLAFGTRHGSTNRLRTQGESKEWAYTSPRYRDGWQFEKETRMASG